MNDEEMMRAYLQRKRVATANHDYAFQGIIISTFLKRARPDGIPRKRCVIENDDGLCLIQSAKNLILVDDPDSVRYS